MASAFAHVFVAGALAPGLAPRRGRRRLALLLRGTRWHGARWRAGIYLFLCTASHGLLDALTDGGRGVGFLLPFDDRRFFLPWRPVPVSPLSAGAFFTPRGLVVLAGEALWIGLPAALLGLALLLLRRRRRGAEHGAAG
ncbi:MAG: LPXTG cell wall anchor domain-containing protein [Planctomycetota bacterium]|nr:MAG: LPXTG cell wall anchor domain-containing protein [Planctomycetota bacterium]